MLRCRRFHPLILNLGLVILSALVFFLMLEITLRLLDQDYRPRDTFHIYTANHLVRWFPLANVDVVLNHPGQFVYRFKTNAKGLRDLERDYTKPAGVQRIVLLGDSFIEGVGLDLADTVAQRLEKLFVQRGEAVEVVNMGVSGYGTEQELLLLQHEGVLYQPDCVVLAFYLGNDFFANGSLLTATANRLAAGHMRDHADDSGPPAWFMFVGRWLYFPYFLKSHWDESKLRMIFSQSGTTPAENYPGPLQEGVPLDYMIYASDRDPEWQEAFARTAGILQDLKAWCDTHRLPLLVLMIPAAETIYDDWWQRTLDVFPAMAKHALDLQKPERQLTGILAQLGIESVSLTAAFKAYDPRRYLYFQKNPHFNARGAELAAQVLADKLDSMAWRQTPQDGH